MTIMLDIRIILNPQSIYFLLALRWI